MAPQDEFEREVERLMDQGCNLDQAIQLAMQSYTDYAITAEKLFVIKQRIARKRRNG